MHRCRIYKRCRKLDEDTQNQRGVAEKALTPRASFGSSWFYDGGGGALSTAMSLGGN
jgi:hypothetical protein